MNSNPRLLNNIDETSLKNYNTNNKINSKISRGDTETLQTVQQVGLYGFNLEVDKWTRINSTNQGVLETENSLDNKRGFGQVLLTSAGGTAVKADTDCTVQEDPEHRVGWNLTNDVGGTKFNLYYFNGTQEVITLGSITSIYARAFINVNSENPSIPFFHIYTKPTGIGDAGPWYHSKIDYTYDFTNIIGIGEECIFYSIEPPTNSFSNRQVQFKNKTVTGDGEDDEEILYMAFSSDSGATQDAVNVTVNLLGFDTKSICRNLNLISESSLTGGATEAMQVLQLDQETVIATNTTSIDNKITKGNDLTLTEAQQVLTYGEVTAGPGAGELHPIHISQAGDVQVEISGLEVKGQALMADSFPVVIASDQSTINVSDVNITVGEDDTLTQAQQVCIYGRKDASPSGLRAIKVSDDGSLHVSTVRNAFTKSNEILALPSNGTVTSTPVNTLSQDSFGISATSTNSTDPIELYASNDNSTFYPTNITGGSGTFYHEIYHPSFNFYRISQTDTTTTAGTINVICSKR
jgi:hypothetical protein